MPPPVDPASNTWNAFGWSAVIISTEVGVDKDKYDFVVIGEPSRDGGDDTFAGQAYVYKYVLE